MGTASPTRAVELVCAEQRFRDGGRCRRATGGSSATPARITEGISIFRPMARHCLPDPRSAWQPDGVHGASFLVDPDELRTISRGDFKPKPLHAAIIYELHVGNFTPAGTYAGAEGEARAPGRAGHHPSRGHAAGDVPRGTWLGPRRRLSVRPPACLRNARGALRISWPRPMPRVSPCCWMSSGNHLGPDGNYLGQFAPHFTDSRQNGTGRGGELRRRSTAMASGAFRDRQRAHVAGCLWLRRTA